MTNSRADAHKSWMARFFPHALGIASTSLQQRQSIFLASFLQYRDFTSSPPELFSKNGVLKKFAKFTGVCSGTDVSCEFCEIFFHKTLFFTKHHQWLLLAFVPIAISYFNNVCNKLQLKREYI